MEQRGLVERQRDDDDRRVVRVALTDGGRELLGGIAAERREHLALLLDELTDDELDGFLRGMRALRGRAPGRLAEAVRRGPTRTTTDTDEARGDRAVPRLPAAATGGRSRSCWSCCSIQAIANLYLPELNAEIINNGVATGDTDYILRTGGFMLVVTVRPDDRRRSSPSTAAPRSRWASAGTSGAAIFRKVETFSPGRGQHVRRRRRLITRNTNDVQQVQQVVLHGADHDDHARRSSSSAA